MRQTISYRVGQIRVSKWATPEYRTQFARFEIHNYTGDIMATIKTAIATMKAAQISRPGGELEIVEREIPKPAEGQVRIKVQACGICHSDAVTKDGMFPWI